ncbi:amidohydrolase family protein [Gordonia sp. JH63]|uniref:amidohydrolase family protein n=1 Tax=Gordonia sp. JH63 TaxID=2698900 RepID=UPI00131F97A7|nr:amidohydrolase family protein [Gordonia sp. JH63]QHD86602.1 amidohydrolase family protein [Gordonia sp. JH63]
MVAVGGRLPVLTEKERALLDVFLPLLPDEIIDAHTHGNLREHVGVIPPPLDALPMSTFAAYDLSDAKAMRGQLWPGKRVSALRFANAFRGIDHRAANNYLRLAASTFDDHFVAFGISDDATYTVRLLRSERPTACKMYARSVVPFLVTIEDVFPPPVLMECSRLGIPIILHLPASLEDSREGLLGIIEKYPNLKVVLAHCGLPRPGYCSDVEVLSALSHSENVVVDTALVVDSWTLNTAFETFGSERVMFGSDEPLSLLRVLEYQHPVKGKRWASTTPYHWLDATDYAEGDLEDRELLLHVQQIMTIVNVVRQQCSDPRILEQLLRGVFHDNAARFFSVE